MTHPLSFNHFRNTLAALGATGLVACAGGNEPAQSPVEAKEVPAATPAAANAPAASDAAAPEAAASTAAAEKPADAAAPAGAPAADAKPSDAAPAAATPSDKPAQEVKKAAAAKHKAAGAKGGCGAGTCG